MFTIKTFPTLMPHRRSVLKGAGALGAAAVLPVGMSDAQRGQGVGGVTLVNSDPPYQPGDTITLSVDTTGGPGRTINWVRIAAEKPNANEEDYIIEVDEYVPESQSSVRLSWTIPEDAPTGEYDFLLEVWEYISYWVKIDTVEALTLDISDESGNGGSSEYLSGTVTDVRGNFVPNAIVEAYVLSGDEAGDVSSNSTVPEFGSRLISKTTADENGSFEFSDEAEYEAGNSDPLLISNLDSLREEYELPDYDQGVIIVAQESSLGASDASVITDGDVWYGGKLLSLNNFLSSDAPLNVQLTNETMYSRAIEINGTPSSQIILSRKILTEEQPQILTLEIREISSGDRTDPDSFLSGSAAFSFDIPEDVSIEFDSDRLNAIHYASPSAFADLLAVDDFLTKGVMTRSSIASVADQLFTTDEAGQNISNGAALGAITGIIGTVASGPAAVGSSIVSILSSFVDLEQSAEITEIGSTPAISRNEVHTVSRGHRFDVSPVTAFQVPITPSDQTFDEIYAAHGIWTIQVANGSREKIVFDHQFGLQPISESTLPGDPEASPAGQTVSTQNSADSHSLSGASMSSSETPPPPPSSQTVTPIVEQYDQNDDGDISLEELGEAGQDFAADELTIEELAEIGQEFAND